MSRRLVFPAPATDRRSAHHQGDPERHRFPPPRRLSSNRAANNRADAGTAERADGSAFLENSASRICKAHAVAIAFFYLNADKLHISRAKTWYDKLVTLDKIEGNPVELR